MADMRNEFMHELHDPDLRPVHCSACLHCKVRAGSVPQNPIVICELGLGARHELKYWAMMRPKHPMGFRQASACAHFESMDDD